MVNRPLRRKLCSRIVIGAALIQIVVTSTYGNDSALNEGAEGPQPLDISRGNEAKLRMLREQLTFHFGKKQTRVIASFTFENTDRTTRVEQLIGFPDPHAAAIKYQNDEVFSEVGNRIGPLLDLETQINGVPVTSSLRFGRVLVENGLWLPVNRGETSGAIHMAWHTIKMSVPPSGRTTVQRRDATDNGHFGYDYTSFVYFTQTGSGWAGTIDALSARVILEDGLRVSDLDWLSDESGSLRVTWPSRSEWEIISDVEMKLLWSDFDPQSDASKRHISLVFDGWPLTIKHLVSRALLIAVGIAILLVALKLTFSPFRAKRGRFGAV